MKFLPPRKSRGIKDKNESLVKMTYLIIPQIKISKKDLYDNYWLSSNIAIVEFWRSSTFVEWHWSFMFFSFM